MHPKQLSQLETEWLDWHARYDHLSWSKMDRLVIAKILPKKISVLKGNTYLCPSCSFGKMIRRAWRTKGKPGKIGKNVKKPGDLVSVDQLMSSHPGIIPRISGRHTRDRISCATCFYDTFSHYSYSHLQRSTTGDETISAKEAFEREAHSNGNVISHYRADNGRFVEKSFRDHVDKCIQTIDFCGVNAHHMNGLIERRIRTLSSGARTILLHAMRMWPEIIGTLLWPFALKAYENTLNAYDLDSDLKSPAMKFAKSETLPLVENKHTFGCPVYVLKNDLQTAGSQIPKWDPRARLGIYLDHSPCHAGSIALVMNPRTLHVSPQFHVVYDDDFTTVPSMRSGDIPDNWTDLVAASNKILQDSTDDVAFQWAKQSAQLELDFHQPTDPLLNPQIVTESVPVNELAKNDTDSNKFESLDNPQKLVPRIDVPDSEGEIMNSEGATPPIAPVLTGIRVSEGATKNSAPITNVSEGVAPTPPDPTANSSTTNSSLHMPKMLDLNETTLRRSRRTGIKKRN